MSDPSFSGPSNSRSNPSRSRSGLSRSAVQRVTGHVSRMLGGSLTLQSTGRFLRRQLWAWPILAAAICGLAGWWVSSSVEQAMRQNRINSLTTIVDADVAALRVWLADQQAVAVLNAADPQLRAQVEQLLALSAEGADAQRRLIQAP